MRIGNINPAPCVARGLVLTINKGKQMKTPIENNGYTYADMHGIPLAIGDVVTGRIATGKFNGTMPITGKIVSVEEGHRFIIQPESGPEVHCYPSEYDWRWTYGKNVMVCHRDKGPVTSLRHCEQFLKIVI